MTLKTVEVSKAYSEAARIYNEALNEETMGLAGRHYLMGRGFGDLRFLNRFQIGFSPYNPKQEWLFNEMVRSHKCSAMGFVEARLGTIKLESRQVNDYMGSQRIIFPLHWQGGVRSFSSRTIIPGVEPRYKTLVYDDLGLYNADQVKYEQERIYIAEGALDTLTLELLGFPAVGIIGLSAFGKENAECFFGYPGEVVIVTDTDQNEAGQKARQKIANVLFGLGVTKVFFKALPLPLNYKSMDISQFVQDRGPYRAKIEFSEIRLQECVYVPTQNKFAGSENTQTTDLGLRITDVVSRYVPDIIQESPERFRSICPLHVDSTPSFVMYSDTNHFKCFGCSEGGGPIRFIMLKEGLGYHDALRFATQTNA